MVEAFAVASGKGGTGKTTTTMALGMALAEEHDVTVIDADTGMANVLFHAGLADVETTLHEVLAGSASVEEAVYNRFGMQVVPCGTSLSGFREARPDRLRDVVATLAEGTDIILLDSPATLGSRSAVLPIILADRLIVVLQPTIPSLSDGIKVQEYATTYGTGVAGILFNRVTDDEAIEDIAPKAEQYFEGETLSTVSESDAVRGARRAGVPLLSYAPESSAAAAYRKAASALTVRSRDVDTVADRFSSAVIPDEI
ncbi:cell division ATPase MinD [Halovenus rubra]|uniref:Cell division ATPase MinD n=2 Tax=Halovenus rubra TaxID=869890 RepID=A0ACC7DY19_9EURY|nr:cell division ATPase MinD [Halovenus rubra]